MNTYYNDEFDLDLNEEPWHTEKWFDEDLLYAMEDEGIEITQENLGAFREYCSRLFDDKTDRNILLRDAVAYCFG